MQRTPRTLLEIAFIVLPIAPAAAQVVLRSHGGPATNSGFGTAVSSAGDVDADGFDDLIVGAPTRDTAAGVDSGSASVYSGRTRAQLYTYIGAQAYARYGRAVSSAGDVDGDGFDDFMIGWNSESANVIGGVDLYSGANGALLGSLGNNGGIGKAIARAGDLNGDGLDDIVVGFPNWSVNQPSAGMIGVFYFRAGTIYSLFYRHGSVPNQRFGASVASLPDVDGDGVRDLLVGEPGVSVLINPTTTIVTGGVRFLSGANGTTIHSVVPTPASNASGAEYGTSVDGAGDVDADGFADAVVGAPGHAGGAGRYETVSGRTGLMLLAAVSSTPGDRLGAAVAGCGDVDGDGRDDVAIGIPGRDTSFATDCGAVYVYSGRHGNAMHIHERETNGDFFGSALARAGDVNGDGHTDLIAGAPGWETPGPLTALNAGQAVVLALTMVRTATSFVSGRFGVSVAGAGDMNGDGLAEYAVATWSTTGSVELRDASGSVIFNAAGLTNDDFGTGLAIVGDVNGDGVDEVAVGAPRDGAGDEGRVYLFSGRNGANLSPAGLVGITGSHFGHAITRLGDVNGDGTADFAVGEPDYDRVVLVGGTLSRAGRVRIFSGAGGAVLRTFRGSAPGEQLGYGLAGLGDVSGDGVPDLAVGIPYRSGGGTGGQIQCYSGGSGAVLWTLDGAQGGESFGWDMANAGDVDGDGMDDVVAAAPFYDSTVVGFTIADRGIVRIVSGATGLVFRSHLGERNSERFGDRVSGAGDVDHDGRADYAVGTRYANGLVTGGDARGGVYVYSGRSGAQLAEYEGEYYTARAGQDVAGIGDVDGDGFDDVLFGMRVDQSGGSTSSMLLRFGGFRGADAYGAGTRGCRGAIRLNTSAPPTLNNALFALTCTGAPPNAAGFGIVADPAARLLPGADLLGFGLLFHLNLLAYPIAFTYPMTSDAQGYAVLPAPIANLPVAGFGIATQVIWFWPSCATSAGGFCSTNGLEVTLQL